MKNALIKTGLFLSIAVIAFLVLQPIESKKHSQKEMDNISKAFSETFSQINAQREAAQASTKQAAQPNILNDNQNGNQDDNQKANQNNNQQAILGVIYKQPDATWFFKAKDSNERIHSISARFKNYFIDQLKFDQNNQPILTHIPESMNMAKKSAMRFATFHIEGVEISVIKLGGQQDTFANIKRWMKQINITEKTPIRLDFKNNKKTIIVRMPK